MKLIKSETINLCDNGACANKADYMVIREDTTLENSLNLCTGCMKTLQELFLKECSPRYVRNLIHKAEKNRVKENDNEKRA